MRPFFLLQPIDAGAPLSIIATPVFILRRVTGPRQHTERAHKMSTIIHTVQLRDGTVGEVSETAPHYLNLGQTVTVQLHDENGMPITATGKIECFLDSDE